jgi:branched-chain amino acid transport system permease protein
MSEFIDSLQFVFAPQMINGLSIGIAVILMALGLTIIFGLLDVINMAHGEYYALGAYVALSLTAMGASFWLQLLLVPLLLLPIGYATERMLIQRVFHHKDRHILTLLLTFGLAIILEDVYKLIYGPQAIRAESPISGATEILGMFLPNYRLFLMAIGTAIIVAVWMVVYRTSLGAMVRAAAFDKNMAASLGVPVTHVYAGTFAFGVALAGLSGVLLAPIYSVFPTMGKDFILMAFSVVIVGGLGSIKGALVAGIVLTQIQAIASLYISPSWTDPLIFAIMVAVLMVRPQGLFGRIGHG